MGQVIGDLLPLALGVAISPALVIAVILMLLLPRATASSVALVAGWVVDMTVQPWRSRPGRGGTGIGSLLSAVDPRNPTLCASAAMTDNNATVMTVPLLVIGVTILGKGIGGLS